MSGISSPWGLSVNNVAGIQPSLDTPTQHLTGQLSLTSTPVDMNGNPLVSQMKGYYTSFGKKKLKVYSKNVKVILKRVQKDISYLKT
jgi:hypothetical protein